MDGAVYVVYYTSLLYDRYICTHLWYMKKILLFTTIKY